MSILSIIGWVITAIVSFFLLKGGFDKIRGTQEMVGNFSYMKLDKYRIVVGIAELLGIVLLVTPGLSLYGMVIIVSLMSGAAALHLSLMGGDKTWLPVVIGVGAILSHLLK
jgi:uncharacterized membrane protein